MNLQRRKTIATLGATTLAAALGVPLARAQGVDAGFTTLRNPLPVEVAGKIEVVEFFWYGCIHCYNMEPLLETWVPKLPADTYFRRIPAVFNDRWAHDANIFYAFEALGVLDKVHKTFFDAIHRDRLKSDDLPQLWEWAQKHGIEPKKLETAMRSFGVQSKVRRANQYTGASQIDGTPALMVQGRFTVSVEQGRTQAGMLANADRLIASVRKAQAEKKS